MKISDLEKKYIAPTYSRQPLTFVEGKGAKLKNDKGKEYLDFVGGIAVCSLGHSNETVLKTIREQSKKIMHVSNLYHIPTQAEFAKKLSEITPEGIQKFFFCNSGTESIEAAFKLAIKHTGRKKIIALEGSFHGRTSAALGATWKKEYREPFKSLISPIFEFIPFNDLKSAKEKVDKDTAAVIAEPIQGEGGVRVPSNDYLSGLKKICNENGTLLIFDEVQTGMCRSGEWFACENWNVEPDIITMAKALGNGFPIGCMGARGKVMDSFSPGNHASTFGGNNLACAVGKTVIETMEKKNIPTHVKKVGGYFKNRLEELVEKYEMIKEARGLGLILAIELDEKEKAEEAVVKARENGFLINRTAGKTLRFVPPLIIKEKQVDQLTKELDRIFSEM